MHRLESFIVNILAMTLDFI